MEKEQDSNIFQRTTLLYGEEALARLKEARVAVFGVGGVGSWCAEALVRTGVGHITLVDADVVDVTNINRQLPATVQTIGRPKAEVMAERMKQINRDVDVRARVEFYTADNADTFALDRYDIIVDAIDSVASKADLILRCTALPGTAFFSSMGAAMRTDPGKVSEAEFYKVRGCALARALRSRFKRNDRYPRRKFRCVYSDETPHGRQKGSSMAVTATFGMRLAALVINKLIAEN